jgi:hypothetical protein
LTKRSRRRKRKSRRSSFLFLGKKSGDFVNLDLKMPINGTELGQTNGQVTVKAAEPTVEDLLFGINVPPARRKFLTLNLVDPHEQFVPYDGSISDPGLPVNTKIQILREPDGTGTGILIFSEVQDESLRQQSRASLSELHGQIQAWFYERKIPYTPQPNQPNGQSI